MGLTAEVYSKGEGTRDGEELVLVLLKMRQLLFIFGVDYLDEYWR